MTTALTIIFILIVSFDVFMVTPFGARLTHKNLEEGKPCYGMIALFISIIPLLVIGTVLGFIK